MAYAIDRQKVSTIGESGYEPPANQTGTVTPTFSSSLNNSALASWGNGYDPAKAKALLESTGFHLGSDGIMTNAAGDKLQFTVINIGDFSDWVASMQVIQQDLKAVGIAISPDNLSSNDFVADLYYGKYQLAYSTQPTFGPGVYYELDNWLNSANTAPVGKPAARQPGACPGGPGAAARGGRTGPADRDTGRHAGGRRTRPAADG
jgi:peptide/nickel transport system substrate-binding protein